MGHTQKKSALLQNLASIVCYERGQWHMIDHLQRGIVPGCSYKRCFEGSQNRTDNTSSQLTIGYPKLKIEALWFTILLHMGKNIK